MIWLLWKLLTLPIRIVWLVFRLVIGTIRFLGVGRLIAFGAGVATGMSVARSERERTSTTRV